MSFKAKLIGILEVSEARGDRMCQEALSDLKMAIRAAGEHKQRIIINIAIDGLRLRDEKTGDSLYHHPVHKISFIAQDMTDSRAFGYIFGSPDTGHRFFGIKTDKAASQVVIAMRDLFQVVFALKKKEIEIAKQSLEKNYSFNRDVVFPETISSSKEITHDSASKGSSEIKPSLGSTESKSSAPVVANLVDLELELNNLQQGISQIERLTPSDPFNSRSDPFGDSFTTYTPKPILPPPPSGRERSTRMMESSSAISPKTPHTVGTKETTSDNTSFFHASEDLGLIHTLSDSQDDTIVGDWFASSVTNVSAVKEQPLQPEPLKEAAPQKNEEQIKQDILKQFDVFTELDPLGTGKIKPYVHKKDFFQELKKPKKVLNELMNSKQLEDTKLLDKNDSLKSSNLVFNVDPFGEDPFDKTDPFAETDVFNRDNFNVDFTLFGKEQKTGEFTSSLKFPSLNTDNVQVQSVLFKSPKLDSGLEKQNSFPESLVSTQLSTKNATDAKFPPELEPSSDKKSLPEAEAESAPKPPPRPTTNAILTQPPPLPPKKQAGDLCMKPPPRPPHTEEIHYDIMINDESRSASLDYTSKDKEKGPPLPAPARKTKPSHFSLTSDFLKKKLSTESSEDDYLTPIPFLQPKEFSFGEGKSPLPSSPQKVTKEEATSLSSQDIKLRLTTIASEGLNCSIENLNFMLSQLTLSGLNDLAVELNIPTSELSNMTLAQITNYLSNIIKNKSQEKMKAKVTDTSDINFADFSNFNSGETHDKYAVFRELAAEEMKATESNNTIAEKDDKDDTSESETVKLTSQDNKDKYAALREIVEKEFKESEPQEMKDDNVETSTDSIKLINKDEEKSKSEETILPSEKPVTDEDENVILKKNLESSLTDMKRESPDNGSPRHLDDVFEEAKPHPASDSISEGASGTSPEIDQVTAAAKDEDTSGKNWTVFDQPKPQVGEKLSFHSEEGVSPWSSDSKEFGNGSPPEWKQTVDSGSDNWGKLGSFKDQEKWWDTSAEPEEYYQSNRRSTDSFEDECYDYCKKRSKRKQMLTASPGSHAAGGHSSSSREVSPWEEEPRKVIPTQRKDSRSTEPWGKHSRQYFEKCRDSWDEEDDYEYDEEHYNRYHWPERHGGRQIERGGYSRGRGWLADSWSEERHFWKQDMARKRHCCQDWELQDSGKSIRHYRGEEWPNEEVCSHKWPSKYEETYCSRDSQDSPWEDEYHHNSPERQTSHYLNLKHHWKRPSSASEVDKKADEIRNKQMQYYLGAGGSDGEKERRYKVSRRSRSRDAYFLELNYHKVDPNLTLRSHHRSRILSHHKIPFKGEIQGSPFQNSEDFTNKKVTSKKKIKDISKLGSTPSSTIPRKCSHLQASFENDFVDISAESPTLPSLSRFTFDYDKEVDETKSAPIRRPMKMSKQKSVAVERSVQSTAPNILQKSFSVGRRPTFPTAEHSISRRTQRSPFEDDFSPPQDRVETDPGESELRNEEEDYFSSEGLSKTAKKLNSNNRFSNNFNAEEGLKKSESVNIFARENDPFDDEFFSGSTLQEEEDSISPKNIKWTQNFSLKENDLN